MIERRQTLTLEAVEIIRLCQQHPNISVAELELRTGFELVFLKRAVELLRDNKDIQTGDRKGLYRATARGCEKAGLKYKPKGLATARVPQSSYQVLQAIEMVSNRPGAGDFLNIQRSTTC